ncbi:MAG: SusC/RagA family TonB-linked outer membrane protein, partial [Lewinella sp.]
MQHTLLRLQHLLLLPALLGAQFIFAQTTVSGIITDQETGEPLIGASILAVGTSTGTITDFDGAYTLEVPEEVTQLQFSYTGYPGTTEDINGRNEINLALTAGELLDEVVVVGYGAVRKEDLTGAVSTIEAESFNRGAIVTPQSLISGKVAGVNISTNSGNPGEAPTVRIRGGTSINASNDPLYVVDGVPLAPEGVAGGRSPLNFLNPDDIASMNVLKDASAAAIYGSRGANGVIIITTKKGESGRPRISYRAEGTISELIDRTQNLDAADFRNVVTYAAPSRLESLGTATTDWFDELTQTGYGTQQNLSISGGGETNTYRVSAGYQQLEGVIRGAETERISLNLNFSQKLFSDKLIVSASLKGANENNQYDPGVINASLDLDPTQPIYDPANTAYGGYFEYGLALAPRNPVSATEQILNTGTTYRGLGNLDLEYKFDDLIPGLTYKVVLGFDANSGKSNRFAPTTYATQAIDGFDGEINIANNLRTSKLFDTYFTYAKEFGVQRASLQVGYSYQNFNFEGPSIRGRDLSTDAFGTANPGVAEDIVAFNSVVENRLISFFGRLNYNFDERYLITASLRRDGSSRFGPSNRWGMFPSAAFAWRILQEDFASALANTFTDLKLRVGYGVTGNQAFGDYLYLPVYQYSDQMTQYQFGQEFVPTIRPNAYDADLKWEETSSVNVGLDFGILN